MEERFKKDLKHYIDMVIEDACKAENRNNDVKYQYCIIQNNLVLVLRTHYRRVLSRIEYRLKRNVTKNFGLIYDRNFDIYDGIDFNYSIAEWNVFGKNMTVRTYPRNPRCYELLNPLAVEAGCYSLHVERLKLLDPNYTKMTWNQYCSAYEQLYGKPVYCIEETVKNYV